MQQVLISIVCVIFALSQAAPSGDPYADDMKQRNSFALECMDQVKIAKEVVEEAIANPTDLPTDPKYKQYLACSYKKQGFQANNGTILHENVKKFLTRFYNEYDLTVLDSCRNVKAVDDGEVAYNYLKCVISILYQIKSTE